MLTREEILANARGIVGHSQNTAYISRGSSQHVRDVMAKLIEIVDGKDVPQSRGNLRTRIASAICNPTKSNRPVTLSDQLEAIMRIIEQHDVPAEPNANPWDHSDPLADLVARFSAAMLEKLRAAEKKYGYGDGWMRDDWRESCQRQLVEHLAKGDPRDVANYCAFMWHHGWPTAPSTISAEKWLVWSNEHEAWWRPERKGYTKIVEHAGRYSHEEAMAICAGAHGGWRRGDAPPEMPVRESDAVKLAEPKIKVEVR